MPLGSFKIRTTNVPAEERHEEQLETKSKFWFDDERDGRTLFKQGRANEDWSEKIAAV